MRHLLDVGAIIPAQPVDGISILFGARQEPPIRHHDRARRIIGEAHVQQLADAVVGRGSLGHHPVQQRGELDQRQLIGQCESTVLRPQL